MSNCSQVQVGELVEAFEIPIYVSKNERYKFTSMEEWRVLAYPPLALVPQ